MRTAHFLTAICCWLSMSCTKTDPPTGSDDPVFMMQYGPEPTGELTAGLNDIYLFTHYEKKGGIVHSIAAFTKTDCPNGDCPGSLQLELYDPTDSSGVLNSGALEYQRPDSLSGLDNYQTTFNSFGQAFQRFDLVVDGKYLSDTLVFAPIDTTIEWFDVPHNVYLFASDTAKFLSSEISFDLQPGAPDLYPRVYISAEKLGPQYRLTAHAVGSSGLSFVWNTQSVEETILVDSADIFDYSVTVLDDFNRVAFARLFSVAFPYQQNFRTAGLEIQSYALLNLGSLAVQWVDTHGTIWRSDRNLQPASSYFNITNIAPYERNEKGDATLKFNAQFRCLLFSPDGSGREFEGQGVAAFAFPE